VGHSDPMIFISHRSTN